MANTIFQDYNQNNPIVSSWLNDINNGVYSGVGVPRKALASSAAWVRFSVTGGVVVIQQSSNIASIVRTGAGVYVVTYGAAMVNAANCYETSMGLAGFIVPSVESVNGVTLTCTNVANAATDPAFLSLVVHGAN
jgi:hypothetical protein